MMAKQSANNAKTLYYVQRVFQHNNKPMNVGDEIRLTSKQANHLRLGGFIGKQKPTTKETKAQAKK